VPSGLLCFVLLLAVGSPQAPPGGLITTAQITGGLTDPVGVTHAGDGSGRLFIVEQHGRIRIWNGSQLLATPFLDISSLVGPCPAPPSGCGERGLLGLAFHPDYETNGFFYVYYTRGDDGDIVVARFQVSADPNVANANSAKVVLTIEHSNNAFHNGGQIAFGPDGYLYIATGDAGGGGDPVANGQNLDVLLGKVLRIDVDFDDFPADPGRNYAIPGDNPFAGAVPGADEIWAYGLRNPWRFSFDRLTADLYIGDVGQVDWEEIDFQPAGSGGGENYGWDCREGAHDYAGSVTSGCSSITSVDPVLEYSHWENSPAPCSSVTGGFVFRNLPRHAMYGDYFFGDFCSGRIWRGVPSGGGAWTRTDVFDTTFSISSFGEGETGRIYFTDLTADDLRWLAPYTFGDVPPSNGFWPFVEALFQNGLTAGCTTGMPPDFCPTQNVTRAEMAVFLVRGEHGSNYLPPPGQGNVFADVPATHPQAAFIEQLYHDGLTAGCSSDSPPSYCPGSDVLRAEMAVFLLRARFGTGYSPPPPTGLFADVPVSYWAAAWIEQLYREGLTAGCGTSPLRYCPTDPVTRGQMAAFLSRTYSLTLP
jgi:glucose/arabinose dehydrogenase